MIAYGSYFDPAAGFDSTESEIGTIAIDGKLAHPAACSDCEEFPAWSPDGKRIAAVTERGIVVSDYPTGQHHRLLRTPGTSAVGDFTGLDWTRDGKWFVYSDDGRIHVMRADGSHGERIAADAEDPRFSPDGKTILFTGTGGWVYLIPRGGGKPKRLTLSGSAAWSSDGTRIASIDGRTVTILELTSGHKQRARLRDGMCGGGVRHWCGEFDWHS